MIAWWGWLLIWTALVLAMLVVLGLFARWLFRKFLTLMNDVSELAAKSALLEVEVSELARPEIAVLADPRDIRRRESARLAHRAALRRERDERRITRARVITNTEVAERLWQAHRDTLRQPVN